MGKKQENPIIRVLVLGAAGVGKNCLESRFTTSSYPPLYDTSLTLSSRRYLTLSPHSPDLPTETRPLDTSHGLEPLRRSQNLEQTLSRRSRSASSTFSNPSSEPQRQDEEEGEAPGSDSSVAVGDGPEAMCKDCRRLNQQDATYLVELTNYPALQNPRTRAQVFAKGEFDAVVLVYDVGDRATFEAAQDLHGEIPLRRRRRTRKRSSAGSSNMLRRSRSSLFVAAGQGFTHNSEGRETVVALVGNKSDVDDEYAGGSLGLDADLVLSEKEAVLQEADVEERSLVHPLYRESRIYDDPPLSPAKSIRSTPNAEIPPRELATDVRRSVLSADHALLGGFGSRRPLSALEHRRSVRTMPLPGHRRVASYLQIPQEIPRTQSIEKWIETGNLTSQDEPEDEPEDLTHVASRVSDGERTAASARQVSRFEGEMMTQTLLLNVPFIETSAKTGRNVEEAFEAVVREVLREMGCEANPESSATAGCRPEHLAARAAKDKKKEKGRNETKKATAKADAAAVPDDGAVAGVCADPNPVDPVLEGTVVDGEADEATPRLRRESVLGRFKRVFTKKAPAMVANVA